MREMNFRRLGAGLLLGLGLVKVASAGGFWISLGNPAANSDPKAKNAVLVVRPDGCHDPGKARVTATAEGIIKGKRQTVRLHPVSLSTPGMYAIQKEWPAEGNWVVSVVATGDALGRTTSAVVAMTAAGFDRESAKYLPRAPAESEIAAALASLEAKLARR